MKIVNKILALTIIFASVASAAQQKEVIPFKKNSVIHFLNQHIDTVFEGPGITQKMDEFVAKRKHVKALKQLRSERNIQKRIEWLRKYAYGYTIYAFELSCELSKIQSKEGIAWGIIAEFRLEEDLLFYDKKGLENHGLRLFFASKYNLCKNLNIIDSSKLNDYFRCLNKYPFTVDPYWLNGFDDYKMNEDEYVSVKDSYEGFNLRRKYICDLRSNWYRDMSIDIKKANDDIKASQIGPRMKPIEIHEEKCNGCKKHENQVNKLLKCEACRSVLYCSIECQKSDWQNHKSKCKELAAQRNQQAASAHAAAAAAQQGHEIDPFSIYKINSINEVD